MGLYVPLDVEYASDDRIMEAGAMPELLYIRALCWCKKNPKTDGAFSWAQLSTFAHGIKSPRACAAKLVETGAWEATPKGCRVAAWLKRNKSGEDIAAAQDMASVLGVQGNHERWHTGPEGKPSPKCPLCLADHRSGTPTTTRSGDPSRVRSPEEEEEPEVKPEEEVKEEEETKPQASAAPVSANSERRPTPGAAALEILMKWKIENTPDVNEIAYRKSVGPKLKDEHRDALAAYLARRPNATARELAAHVLKVPNISAAQSEPLRDWYADPSCECRGDGITNLAPEGMPATYGNCPCRRSEPYPEPPEATVLAFKPRTEESA